MPYKSDAQRRLFHAKENSGEFSHAMVKEWDSATKGMKLPEKLHKKASLGEAAAKYAMEKQAGEELRLKIKNRKFHGLHKLKEKK
jgi:hypothetical protein